MGQSRDKTRITAPARATDRISDQARALARHAARLRAGWPPRSSTGRAIIGQTGTTPGSPGRAAGRRAPFDLALLSDERAGDPTSIIDALPVMPGVRLAVIFRHYDTRDRTALAHRIATACRRRGSLLLIAGDPGLAIRVRADGIHLPEWQAARIPGIRHAQPHWIISTACHGLPALRQAERLGADCGFLSPVFDTASHAGSVPLGMRLASALAGQVTMPVMALGGVNRHLAGKIKPGIFAGFGAIDGFTG